MLSLQGCTRILASDPLSDFHRISINGVEMVASGTVQTLNAYHEVFIAFTLKHSVKFKDKNNFCIFQCGTGKHFVLITLKKSSLYGTVYHLLCLVLDKDL